MNSELTDHSNKETGGSPHPVDYLSPKATSRVRRFTRKQIFLALLVVFLIIGAVCLVAVIHDKGMNRQFRQRRIAERVACAANMKKIYTAIQEFQRQNGGRYPDSLADLWQAEPSLIDGSAFIDPSVKSHTPAPSPHFVVEYVDPYGSSNDASCHDDYYYRGKGLSSATVTGETVILIQRYDWAGGTHRLYADGRVEWAQSADDRNLFGTEPENGN